MATLGNLVNVAVTSSGTGTMTLGAAVPGFLTMAQAGIANGSVVSYGVIDGVQSEVGRGVYNSAANTISRGVLRSTNGNALINISTGPSTLIITALAEDLVEKFDKAGGTISGATTFSAAATIQGLLTAGAGITSTGLITSNGNVALVPPAGAAQISMKVASTGQTRYLHHDGSLIGLLNASGGWNFRMDDAGQLWTAQLGDLATALNLRVAASRFGRSDYGGPTVRIFVPNFQILFGSFVFQPDAQGDYYFPYPVAFSGFNVAHVVNGDPAAAFGGQSIYSMRSDYLGNPNGFVVRSVYNGAPNTGQQRLNYIAAGVLTV